MPAEQANLSTVVVVVVVVIVVVVAWITWQLACIAVRCVCVCVRVCRDRHMKRFELS